MIISKNCSLGLLLLLFTLSACDSDDKSSRGKPAKAVHQVETVAASIAPVSQQQTITGTLEAATIVHLHNELNGKITALPYYEGDKVSHKTPVIVLDDDLVEAEMEKAVAQKKQARLDLARLKKLIPKKLASEEDLTRAATELEIATAEVKLQKTRLAKTVVLAPFDGVVTARNYEPGDVVPQHSHILTMIDPDSLHIKLQLSESWLPLIDINSSVEVSIDALGGAKYDGSITRIHPTIDPNTRKGIVEVSLNPLPGGAKSGQLARIKINSTATDRLLVPSYAVRHDSLGAYVFVVNEQNKAIKTYITKGLEFADQMEITDGLNENQAIIIKGFTALRDGLDVEIIENNTETP